MSDARARQGRPSIPGRPGKRNTLGLRVSAETKEQLRQAADASGRSMSQEAEMRLLRSFEVDAGNYLADLLAEVQTIRLMMEAARDRG